MIESSPKVCNRILEIIDDGNLSKHQILKCYLTKVWKYEWHHNKIDVI